MKACYLIGAPLLGVLGTVLAVGLAGNLGSQFSFENSTEAAKAPDRDSFFSADRVSIAHDPDTKDRTWTSIVFHHSATSNGSASSFDHYHRAHHGWRSLGYHFVIGNGTDTADGKIEVGPRWRRQEPGAHANSYEFNQHGIGICLVGNFELAPPSTKQLQAARQLVKRLRKQYGIPRAGILTHQHVRQGGGTACPGRFFRLDAIADDLH